MGEIVYFGQMSCISMYGTCICSYHLFDFHGKLVGKYAVRPMDTIWVVCVFLWQPHQKIHQGGEVGA